MNNDDMARRVTLKDSLVMSIIRMCMHIPDVDTEAWRSTMLALKTWPLPIEFLCYTKYLTNHYSSHVPELSSRTNYTSKTLVVGITLM